MKLSVIVPSIRTENLVLLYNSIDIKNFEMIIVSSHSIRTMPYDLNIHYCLGKIKWLQSWRCPCAAQQQGLMLATGDYVTWAADDGVFLPGALDKAIKYLDFIEYTQKGIFVDYYKTIVIGKYLEGENPKDMDTADYYKFGFHKVYRLKGIPQDTYIFNCGLISRKFILELGGWDAEHFDVPTVAHADLGIRAHKAGAEMILVDDPMFKCGHMPGKTGDHAPIHNAMKKDLKKLKYMYGNRNVREKIHLDNWKLTPEVWKERFGK